MTQVTKSLSDEPTPNAMKLVREHTKTKEQVSEIL